MNGGLLSPEVTPRHDSAKKQHKEGSKSLGDGSDESASSF